RSAVYSQLDGTNCAGTVVPSVVFVNSRIRPAPVALASSTLIDTGCPAVRAIPLAWVQLTSLGPVAEYTWVPFTHTVAVPACTPAKRYVPVAGGRKLPSHRATKYDAGNAGGNGESTPQSTLTCGSVRTSTGAWDGLMFPLCDRSLK